MVVHDDVTLEEALSLVDVGPVKFSDAHMFTTITSRDTLEGRCKVALGRGDVAVVVPLEDLGAMETHSVALRRIKARRREQEQFDIKSYFRTHPDSVENVEKHAKRRGEL